MNYLEPDALRAQAAELEKQAQTLRMQAAEEEAAARKREMAEAAKIPVDRSAQQLTTGAPVPEDGSHTKLGPDGQQEGYVVLSAAERAKGFVRPFRDAYRHQTCGKITTMGRSLAETYARDPFFYSGTFCATCRAHFPVGAAGEFTWYEMDGREGPKVGNVTTKHSPISQLKAQADRIAASLKSAERGDKVDVRFAQKIAAARAKESVKVGVVMDDKVITIDMPWATIRGTSEAGLAEWILDQMREARDVAGNA